MRMKTSLGGLALATGAILAGCAVGHRVVGTPVTPAPAAGTDYHVRNGGSKPVDWFVVRATYPDPDGETAFATPRPQGVEVARYRTTVFVVFRRLGPGNGLTFRVEREFPAETAFGMVYLVAPDVAQAIGAHGTVLMFDECGQGTPPDKLYGRWRASGWEVLEKR